MKIEHYSLERVSRSARPSLLFEVRVDLQDVRSGYRDSDSFLLRADWAEPEDGAWTSDMVDRVSEGDLRVIQPPHQVVPPVGVEDAMTACLLRFLRPTVWRNYPLAIYSHPWESRQDFIQRCREQLVEKRTEAMGKLRRIYMHHIGELEKKALDSIVADELVGDLESNLIQSLKNVFGDIREDLSDWFVRDDHRIMDPDQLQWELETCPAVHDRLIDIKNDLASSYNEISAESESLAGQVEKYDIAPNYSDIGVSLKGILWK